MLEHTGMKLADIGHHKAHRVGEVGLHGGCESVATIAECADGLSDLVAIAGPDGLAVEVARDRADGDTGAVCDVHYRWLALAPAVIVDPHAAPSKTTAAWMRRPGTVTVARPSE